LDSGNTAHDAVNILLHLLQMFSDIRIFCYSHLAVFGFLIQHKTAQNGRYQGLWHVPEDAFEDAFSQDEFVCCADLAAYAALGRELFVFVEVTERVKNPIHRFELGSMNKMTSDT
jgi:hypothetical protein